MLLETSAIVAILTGEDGVDMVEDALAAAAEPVTTPLAMFEAALVLATRKGIAVRRALDLVRRLLEIADVKLAPSDAETAEIAAKAADRFGKGRGHPAQLNLCDCLAYATATQLKVPMLFVGNDFSHTDVTAAVPGPTRLTDTSSS